MRMVIIRHEQGFTLLEVLMVIAIIGVLASIAIPNYLPYRERAWAAECAVNRHYIDMAEQNYYLQHNKANLQIGTQYQCPSGGTLVWLVYDSEDDAYPEVGCSVHYAGSLGTPDQAIDSPPATLGEELDKLADYARSLDLPSNVEYKLLNRLTKAKKRYEKGQIGKSVKALARFKKQIYRQRKKIDDEDEKALISIADKIKEMLKQSP